MTFLLLALALQDAPEADILRAADAGGGLAVVLGVGDGALAERLASRGGWVVHALEADAARVRTARERLSRAGLGGRATVEHAAWPSLPYGDLLVNLLVAADPAVDDAEILRVLAPEGRAWTRRDGRWTATRKARPAEFGEWTHSRHAADGNMVSTDRAVAAPQGIRWIAGPAQDDGGRKWYYDHILVSSGGRNIYATEEGLVARDASNGLLLWSRAFKAPAVKEKGLPLPLDAPVDPKKPLKLGQRATRVRPVLRGDALYLTENTSLLEIDARSGETRATLGDVREPRDILVDGGLLIVSDADGLRAWSLETRKLAWKADVDARRMAASGGGLFAVTATDIARFDLATGKVAWRTPDPDAALALSVTAKDGFLVLEKSSLRDDGTGCGIRVYGTEDGALRWARDYKPDMTHYREARAYFAKGLLWIQGDKDKILGLDPKSGSERLAWGSQGKHCASPVATERFFMAPECEFTDFETGVRTRSRIFKSACRLPFIPANGLLYTFPVQCECFPMLRGYMALAPTAPPTSLAKVPRLTPGAAADAAPLLKPAEAVDAEWPTYRHDVHRSAATPMAISADRLKVAWTAKAVAPAEGPSAVEWRANPYVRGPLTPPVAAAGRVIVAAPDRHLVLAFDARDGKALWTFEAEGRIDLPPTIHEGLCLFGGRDGRVYALRVADGALAWRLRLAPVEARLPAWGQLESPWPVVGSVLVDGGVGYAAAGRHPSADGGVKVVAFKPRTG
ncbi:MAG TPA: PQQ-binding-like beta-propeller repeat protein, partial [Planctomycetota bacterium]